MADVYENRPKPDKTPCVSRRKLNIHACLDVTMMIGPRALMTYNSTVRKWFRDTGRQEQVPRSSAATTVREPRVCGRVTVDGNLGRLPFTGFGQGGASNGSCTGGGATREAESSDSSSAKDVPGLRQLQHSNTAIQVVVDRQVYIPTKRDTYIAAVRPR